VKEILPYCGRQGHPDRQSKVPWDKEYKDTLLISTNEP
jgi:hypothetical protein